MDGAAAKRGRPRTGDKWRERIIEMFAERGGVLEPDEVIEEARNPQSPLHSQFDWDIEKAAFEHWRAQARQLIRGVFYERTLHSTTVNVLLAVRDPRKEYHEQGYIETAVLSTDLGYARQALEREFRYAEAALHRAFEVADALELQSEVGDLLKSIGILKMKVSQ
jgi:hypothetical protein